MSLLMLSENGSACGICGPFEGSVFTDTDDLGYENISVVESAGAFHDGCLHSWVPVGEGDAVIKKEDELLARGTEWDERAGSSDFPQRPDFDTRWQMLTKTNGQYSSGELSSLTSYTNSGYVRTNATLRNVSSATERDLLGTRSAIKNMDNVMVKSELKHDMTLWRGTNSNILDKELLERVLGRSHGLTDADLKRLVGETFTDKGYFSTSAFKGGAFGSRRYEMQIVSPKGTRAAWVGPNSKGPSAWRPGISQHTTEMEFILDRNTEFRILQAYKLPNGNIRLNVIARQKAVDPVARLAAEKAEARAANALAKKAAQTQQQPTLAPKPAPQGFSGPLPSPSSVAKALEKIGAGPLDASIFEVQAAWIGPNQMAIKLVTKSNGSVFKEAIVAISKAEAQAAKAAGNYFQAVQYVNKIPAPAPVSSAATSAVSTAAGKVSAAEVKQLLIDLGMKKGQLAKATGKSPSLITEWTGGGHGNLLNQSAWQQVKNQAVAWAKTPY